MGGVIIRIQRFSQGGYGWRQERFVLNEFGYYSLNGLEDVCIKLIRGRGHAHLKQKISTISLSNAIR